MHKKAFTLLEILIVVVIVGILSVVLIRTYVTVTRIAFRVQQEEAIVGELGYVQQYLQNQADRATIDYDRYATEYGSAFLVDNAGIVDTLFLRDGDQQTAIYASGNCLSSDMLADTGFVDARIDCQLVAETNNTIVSLIDTKQAVISQPIFAIIPYSSERQLTNDPSLCSGMYIGCLHHPGFRVQFVAYTPHHNPASWTHQVSQPVQYFFTVQQ